MAQSSNKPRKTSKKPRTVVNWNWSDVAAVQARIDEVMPRTDYSSKKHLM